MAATTPTMVIIKTTVTIRCATSERFDALVKDRKITFDLLCLLFKPNELVCSTCPGIRKPRCVKYDFSEEKTTIQGVKFFELECRYLDFDGQIFGEVIERLEIEKFRGTRPIDSLDVFPIRYYPAKENLEK